MGASRKPFIATTEEKEKSSGCGCWAAIFGSSEKKQSNSAAEVKEKQVVRKADQEQRKRESNAVASNHRYYRPM